MTQNEGNSPYFEFCKDTYRPRAPCRLRPSPPVSARLRPGMPVTVSRLRSRSTTGIARGAALSEKLRVRRTKGEDSPVLRIASCAGRMHVSSARMTTTRRRSGGRLLDRSESVVVVVSTGRSGSSRGSLHASPGCTAEEQASQGRHPLAVSMGFRAQPPTSQPSSRSPSNCHALPPHRSHRSTYWRELAPRVRKGGAEDLAQPRLL